MTSRHIETVRQPLRTRPKPPPYTPPEHACSADFCGSAGAFCLGPPIEPAPTWFCPAHKPADFYERGGRR